MSKINIINELLDDAQRLVEEHKNYDKHKKESAHEFNVFSVFRLERCEVKTHPVYFFLI